jgi:hypothetical protein
MQWRKLTLQPFGFRFNSGEPIPVSKSVLLIVPSEEAVYSTPSLAVSNLNKIISSCHISSLKKEPIIAFKKKHSLHTVQNTRVHRIVSDLLMQLNIIPNA